jgi:hypothetical protein
MKNRRSHYFSHIVDTFIILLSSLVHFPSLASTYLLTRISVVHHAALNCTRRIFAIVCTSLLFMIPITFLSALGITMSFFSFMLFTYAKTTKNKTNNKAVFSVATNKAIQHDRSTPPNVVTPRSEP